MLLCCWLGCVSVLFVGVRLYVGLWFDWVRFCLGVGSEGLGFGVV